ncbi:MAG: hypothetical protein KatS3mg031_1317 [Chitinophagales bacterium]|nr:MAG: hypothetical protein KatS3mg031_1317 [Chitinophagales bacterium]
MRLFRFILPGSVILLTAIQAGYGQDPHFSQFNAAPLYLNPALAGISYGPRVNLNYRNQWPSIDKGYVTFAASYDMHIPKLSGGIGIQFLGDRIANGLLSSYHINAMYAYQLRLGRNFGIKIGAMGGYAYRSVDWARLTFGDQINPVFGFYDEFGNLNPTAETNPSDFSMHQADVGAGFVAFSSFVYGGVSVVHISRPRDAFFESNDAILPLRVSVHAGGDINLLPKRPKRELILSPNVLLMQQSGFLQLNAGTFLYSKYVYGGMWFRHTFKNSDAVIGVVGIKVSYVKVAYSYDYTVSRLQGLSGGAHEVSVTFNMGGDDNSLNSKRLKGQLECPRFLNF